MSGKLLIFVTLLATGLLITVSDASTCSSDEFYCEVQDECIDREWICDDFDDCADGADETPALCQAGGDSESAPPSGGDSDDSSDDDTSSEERDDDSGDDSRRPAEVPELCSLKECTGNNMQYMTGRNYRYTYSTETVSQVTGTSVKQSKYNISCQVELIVLTACEMEIKLTDVEVIASKADGDLVTITDHSYINDLTANSLRFSMMDGVIDTVCPRANESLDATNFKRGVISILQNSMPRFDLPHSVRENDILGECNVAYTFEGTKEDAFQILKKKDVNSCSTGPLVSSSVKSIPYFFIDGAPQARVMDVESECSLAYAKKRLKEAECKELYKVTPYRRGDGGVQVTVTQTLNFRYETFYNPVKGEIKRRTGLPFQYTQETADSETVDSTSSRDSDLDPQLFLQVTQRTLDTIAAKISSSRRSMASPTELSQLLTLLRRLSLGQLRQLLDDPRNRPVRGILETALSEIGTSSSVGLISGLLRENPSHERADEWVRSLSFLARPDEATINATATILSLPNVPNQAFLALGSVIRSYCDYVGPNCRKSEAVLLAMAALEGYLKDDCFSETRTGKIQALMAMKGIGNAGHAATQHTADLLLRCHQNNNNEYEIRVAALNAFRFFPCGTTEALKEVLKDITVDSELRIAAYLGVMRCADYDTTALVKNVLEAEEVNQVGSFIWSHLTNIQEGGMPSKCSLQALLSSLDLQEKYNTDARKFSRNIEWSAFYDPINAGVSIESNVAFSQNSYIPRSASLNFTTDLFGHSINWFELDTRVEGLERPIEQLLMGGVPNPVPPEEGVNNERIRKLMESSGKASGYQNKDPELSMGMKIFGNEVYFQHIHGFQAIKDSLMKFDPRTFIDRINSGETISLQKATRFIESSGTVATSAGLGLTIALEGTVSLDVSARGRIELGAIFPFNPTIDIRGTLTPNIESELRASVMVDGIVSQTGAQLEATLNSNTVLQGRVVGSGLESFSLNLNVPNDRMEVVNMTSQVSLIHFTSEDSTEVKAAHNTEVLEANDGNNYFSEDCTHYAEEIGSKICWSSLYPNVSEVENIPKYPLTGSSHFRVIFHKTDPQLKSYLFKYNLLRQESIRVLEVSAMTPGTDRDREHSLLLSLESRLSTATFKYHSPSTHLDAKGRYTWSDDVKSIDVLCHINEEVAAELELSLRSYSKATKSYYSPVARIKWRGQNFFTLNGDVEVLGRDDSELYRLDLNFSVNRLINEVRGKVTGSLSTQATNSAIDILVDYSIHGEDHTITISYDVENTSDDLGWKLITRLRILFSQFNTLNLVWNNVYRLKSGHIETNLNINFGEQYLNPDHAVHFHRSISVMLSEETMFFNSTIGLKHNMRNIDIKLGGDLFTDRRHIIETGFIFQLVSGREISSRLKLQKTSSPLLESKGDFQLKVPTWNDINLFVSINETEWSRYQLYALGTTGEDQFLELKGNYRRHVDLQSHHMLLLAVRLPNRGVTNVNVTGAFNWTQAMLSVEVVLDSGLNYKGMAEYKMMTDQFNVRNRNLHFEVHLPDKVVRWTINMAAGTVITIVNRIQIDRTHDINVRLVLDILKDDQRGLSFSIQWDPNRNPLKKLELTLAQNWTDPRKSNVKASLYLGLLSHVYQFTWNTQLFKDLSEDTLVWEHSHHGSLLWEETLQGLRQEVSGKSLTRLVRGDTARFIVQLELLTPFEHWRENYLNLNYTRDLDSIRSTLSTGWHDDEVITAEFTTEKSYESLASFSTNSKLDLRSSFRGMSSLSSGAEIKRGAGYFESLAFIKWEEDKVELRLEGHDRSADGHLELSAFAEVLTSLQGYSSISGEVYLRAASGNIQCKAAGHWDAVSYELRCRGNRNEGDDYLNGEVVLILPGYGTDDFTSQLRIFDDLDNNRHRLTALTRWYGRTLKVEGEVTAERHGDFYGRLGIETPFPGYRHASLVLGRGFDGVDHKSEARLTFGEEFDVGFVIKAHATSLRDYLVSVAIHTPFENYKEIKAEILNLYIVSPYIKAHSRIFAQFGDKKYGIGGRYENGLQPRIRMAFEVYTAMPNLETLILDLSDSSLHGNSEYNLLVQYGYNSPLKLNVIVLRGNAEEDWAVTSFLPFSLVDPLLVDVDVRVEAGMSRGQTPRVTFAADITTSVVRKLFLHYRLPPNEVKEFEASVGGIFSTPGYEQVSFKANFQYPEVSTPGYLDVTFRTEGAGVSTLHARTESGDYKTLTASYTSPFAPFRTGTLSWLMVPLDIERERVTASLSWETGVIEVQGTSHTRDGVVYRMEATVSTPWSYMRSATLLMDNIKEGAGYTTTVSITDAQRSCNVHMNYFVTSDNTHSLAVGLKITAPSYAHEMKYSGHFQWKSGGGRLLYEAKVATPLPGYEALIGKIDLQASGQDYTSLVFWNSSSGSGTLELKALRDIASRSIQSNISLTLDHQDGTSSIYNFKVDLDNRSTNDKVDLDMVVELTTNQDNWDRIKVEGTVVQVTSEPGEVGLSLTWPKYSPVSFRGVIDHEDTFSVIKPSVTLEVNQTVYAVEGELHRDGDHGLRLLGIASYKAHNDAALQQIKLNSEFIYNNTMVNGSVSLSLPFPEPWATNTLDVQYQRIEQEHTFRAEALTGGEVTSLEGRVRRITSQQLDGTIKLASTLKWNSHPLELTFTQSLTPEQYIGGYELEFPLHDARTDTWTRGKVVAALNHDYMSAGHKGQLILDPHIPDIENITINYTFEFPRSQDLTVEVGVTYKKIVLSLKVEEITVYADDGEYKKRFTVELENPIWPFGFESYKTVSPEGSRDTVLKIFDIRNRDRHLSLTLSAARADQGFNFTVSTVVPGGRLVSLSSGYIYSEEILSVTLNFSWAQNEFFDVAFHWRDVSQDGDKRHVVQAWVRHPIRAVVFDAKYQRIDNTLYANFTYNWNEHNHINKDILEGMLELRDLSSSVDRHYRGTVDLQHPALIKGLHADVELQRSYARPIMAAITLNYTPEQSPDFVFLTNITRLREGFNQRFNTVLRALHPQSNLSFIGESNLIHGGSVYSFGQRLNYTTSSGHLVANTVNATLDLLQRDLQILVDGTDRDMVVHLSVVREGAGRWRLLSDGDSTYPLKGLLELHPVHPMVTVTVENIGNSQLLDSPQLNIEKVILTGGVEDMRNIVFSLSRVATFLQEHDDSTLESNNSTDVTSTALPPTQTVVLIKDIDFYCKLNHTRLLTSKLVWRPSLQNDLLTDALETLGVGSTHSEGTEHRTKEALRSAARELLARTRPVLQDLMSHLSPIVVHFKNESLVFLEDLHRLHTLLNLTEEEISRLHSFNFIFSKFSATVMDTRLYQMIMERMSNGGLKDKIIDFMARVKASYEALMSSSGSGLREQLQSIKRALAEGYDRWAKKWYLKLSEVIGGFKQRVSHWLSSRWYAVYYNYKEHVITTFNSIETAAHELLNSLSGVVRDVRQGMRDSSYFQFITNFISKVRRTLDNIFQRSLKENFQRVWETAEDSLHYAVQFFLREVAPFLEDWLADLKTAWDRLEQYDLMRILRQRMTAFVNSVVWAIRSLNIKERVINVTAFIVENGYTIVTQTALDAEYRQRKAKSVLKFHPEDGTVEFEQKLPTTWRYFNENPKWEDLKEWRALNFMKGLFNGGRSVNIMEYWYKHFSLQPDYSTWLPPFQGTSQVIGDKNLVSWNGRLSQYRGRCRHVLAADLVFYRWAVVLNYHANAPNAYIVYIDGKRIEMEQGYSVRVDGRTVQLPVVLTTTIIYRHEEELVLTTEYDLNIIWNQLHDVFTLNLPGVYFGKVGGMLGSNNYESMDDALAPDYSLPDSLEALASAWSVSIGSCNSSINTALKKRHGNERQPSERCQYLFSDETTSPFKYCFHQASPVAYSEICNSVESPDDEMSVSCAAASAYRKKCAVMGVPSKVPHDCSECAVERADGSVLSVPESHTIEMAASEVPRSTDVVIIIEMSECNSGRNLQMNLRRFFDKFDEELSSNGLELRRYAVVTYGGAGFFRPPRQILSASDDLFTPITGLTTILANVNLNAHNRSESAVDTFDALRFASNLPFRAGITPAFILMTCSACPKYMGPLDFATMYHILVDRGAVLHLLTPHTFEVSKQSLANKLLGIDSSLVFTTRDSGKAGLKGDSLLRRQVGDLRDQLEYCSPLALQTNGSIFTSRWLNARRRRKVEQTAIVLGRRVAMTAMPLYNQLCICLPTNQDSVKTKCHRLREEWGDASMVAPYFDE